MKITSDNKPSASKEADGFAFWGRATGVSPHVTFMAFILALAAVLLLVNYPISDPDTFWHIANGKQIVQQGRILNKEVFSYTKAGFKYSDHEWLSQVIFYLVYSAAGAAGLAVLKSALVALMFTMLYAAAFYEGRGLVLPAFLFPVMGVLMAFERYAVRPQLFSYMLIALVLLIYHGCKNLRLRPRWLWLLPPAMIVWDFLQGAVFGLVMLVIYAFVEAARLIIYRKKEPGQDLDFSRKVLLVCAVAAAAMLVSPYGFRSYDIFAGYLKNSVMISVNEEFMSPLMLGGFPLFWSVLAGAWILVLITTRRRDFSFAGGDGRNLAGILVMAAYTALSLRYSRMISVFGLVSVPVLAGRTGRLAGLLERLRIGRPKITLEMIAAAGLSICVIYIAAFKFNTDGPYRIGYKLNQSVLPVGAARFVKEANLEGNMYNPGHMGGYLAYKLFPQRRIFLYNHVFFSDITAMTMDPDFTGKFHINYAVYGNGEVESAMVFTGPRWVPLFWDEAAVVSIKNSPANGPVISRYGLKYFLPNASEEQLAADEADPKILPALVREAASCLYYSANNSTANYLGWLIIRRALGSQEVSAMLRRALVYNGSNAMLWSALGVSSLKQDDKEAAYDEFEKSAALDRGFSFPRIRLSELALGRGNVRKAEALLREARKSSPDDPEIYMGLSIVHGKLGESAKAANDMRKYRELTSSGR